MYSKILYMQFGLIDSSLINTALVKGHSDAQVLF